jgi:5S rRNA maturation endonuclease (ribonuclease M5)
VDALGLVMWIHGDSPAEAATRLRGFIGEPEPWNYSAGSRPTIGRPSEPVRPKPPAELEPVAYTAPTDTTERLGPTEATALLDRYLRSRGWPSDVVERFGLEAIRDTSGVEGVRHPFYVTGPDGAPVVMWWQDRLRSRPGAPKWKAPKGHRPIPYNLPALGRDGLSYVVVCEGPADTITTATALHGSPDVAVIGIPGSSSWVSGWAGYLLGLTVIVATDNDRAGDSLAERIAADLQGQTVIRYRPRHGDMTDTARTVGMDVIGQDLRDRLVTIATETVMAEVFGADGWSWVVTDGHTTGTEAVA